MRRTVEIHGALDPPATLGPLAHGRNDPCTRIAADRALLARSTADGPATLELTWDRLDPTRGGPVEGRAWGPGAEALLDRVSDLLGAHDDPEQLLAACTSLRDTGTDDGVRQAASLVATWARRRPGVRMTRTAPVTDVVVAAVLGQLVQGVRAKRSWTALVLALGEAAPGPDAAMRVPPTATVLARQPYEAFHRFDVERRRADVIRRVAAVAPRLEETTRLDPGAATARLTSIPGIGPWTATKTVQVTHADPDAAVVGDFNLPSLVAHALAGERTADDARMLELLAPFAGQRARVQRLAKLVGARPPRRGPRLSLEPITRR